jgi:hypothetical protein
VDGLREALARWADAALRWATKSSSTPCCLALNPVVGEYGGPLKDSSTRPEPTTLRTSNYSYPCTTVVRPGAYADLIIPTSAIHPTCHCPTPVRRPFRQHLLVDTVARISDQPAPTLTPTTPTSEVSDPKPRLQLQHANPTTDDDAYTDGHCRPRRRRRHFRLRRHLIPQKIPRIILRRVPPTSLPTKEPTCAPILATTKGLRRCRHCGKGVWVPPISTPCIELAADCGIMSLGPGEILRNISWSLLNEELPVLTR